MRDSIVLPYVGVGTVKEFLVGVEFIKGTASRFTGFEDSVVLGEGGADNWEKKPYTSKYKAVHFYEGLREIELPADFYSSKFYTDELARLHREKCE